MKARRYTRIMPLLLVIAFLVGCGSGPFETEDARDEIRAQYGPPEEVNTYDSEGYWTETWWYWSRGVSFTFVREAYGDIDLESTYTFSPITL